MIEYLKFSCFTVIEMFRYSSYLLLSIVLFWLFWWMRLGRYLFLEDFQPSFDSINKSPQSLYWSLIIKLFPQWRIIPKKIMV